jgi:hypothetical protein
MKKTIKQLVALASAAVATAAGAAPAGSIGPADIKGEWPLTVQPVRVLCQVPDIQRAAKIPDAVHFPHFLCAAGKRDE